MKSFEVTDFNLKYTLECGQFFRYKEVKPGLYLINYIDVLFLTRQEGKQLFHSTNVERDFIIKFFRLEDEMQEIYNIISTDDYLKKAIEEYKGLRLIRQDPWECLISYICSAAANIPKIQTNIEKLSEFFGRPISCKTHTSFSFPEIKTITQFERVQEAKTGFRAKYIHEVNEIVSEEFFEHIKNLDYKGAKKELTNLPGVGEKIADCVLLFSLNHLEAFPMDTWIAKAMQEIYKIKPDHKTAREFSQKKWGKYAGYAQQYIYMKYRSENGKKQTN